MNKHLASVLAAAGLVLAGANAEAAGVLNTGTISMGLFDGGGLGFSGVGLNKVGTGDAITPGCLCEGWGAAANGVGNYTYAGGTTGFTSASLVISTPTNAVSTVVLSNGLTVKHTYSSAAGGSLFKVAVAITNTSGAAVTDVRYARTLDWDVPPGHFSEDFTTIYGGTPSGPGGKVLHTSFNPFAAPNPMVLRGTFGGVPANTNGVDKTGDLGAYFILAFGGLGVGEEVDFTTYIGAEDTTKDLLAAFASVGIEAYSYSYDNDGPATFGWGFAGIGLPPVFGTPEPGSLLLMGAGLAGVGAIRRRRKA